MVDAAKQDRQLSGRHPDVRHAQLLADADPRPRRRRTGDGTEQFRDSKEFAECDLFGKQVVHPYQFCRMGTKRTSHHAGVLQGVHVGDGLHLRLITATGNGC